MRINICNIYVRIMKDFFHEPKWTEGMCYAFDIGTGGDEGFVLPSAGVWVGIDPVSKHCEPCDDVMVKIYLM